MSLSWSIATGHVLDVLRTMPEASVHCVVTSPPYWGLRDYGTGRWEGGDPECDHTRNNPREDHSHGSFLGTRGTQAAAAAGATPYRDVCGRCGAKRIDQQLGLEPTPKEFVARLVAVFNEVRRVLRDDGTCWVNLGDSYATQPYSDSHSFDPKYGGRNRRAGYPNRQKVSGLKHKDLVGVPWRVAFALQRNGWYLRSDIVWHKPNPMPESVDDRPTKSHEYVFMLTKRPSYFYDADAIREAVTGNAHSRGVGVNPKARTINQHRLHRPKQNDSFSAALSSLVTSRNRRSVWTFTTQPFPGAHFATFPEELPATCILAGTSALGCCNACGAPYERIVELGAPLREQQEACGGDAEGEYHGQARKTYEGTGAQNASDLKRRILEGMRERKTVGWRPTCACQGAAVVPCTVLDPFNGSGTTGAVAIRLGRSYRGIDLSPEYVAIARQRIGDVAPLLASEVVA